MTDQAGSPSEFVELGGDYERAPLFPAGSKGCCSSRGRRCALLCAAFVVGLCAILVPLTLFVVVPDIGQGTMDNSHLVMMNGTMSYPSNNTLILSTMFEMSSPGLVSATLTGGTIFVSLKDGSSFGHMELPTINVDSSQTYVNVTSVLTVTDVHEFTKATASVLQGHSKPWALHGRPKVKVPFLGMKFSVNLEKTFILPSTLFVQTHAYDVSFVETTPSSVICSASTSFFSSSVLELRNIGLVVFNLTTTDGLVLGTVTVPNFEARRDFNVLQNITVNLEANEDNSNIDTIRDFLHDYAQGNERVIVMRGPIESNAPFLSNVVTQDVTMKGQRMIYDAVTSNMVITKTTPGYVNFTATATFSSDLNVSASALGGAVVLAITDKNKVKMGEAVFNSDIKEGANSILVTGSLLADTPEGTAAAQKFLQGFTSGKTQEIMMTGPIRHFNVFMNDFLTAVTTVPGAKVISNGVASNLEIVSSNATSVTAYGDMEFISELSLDIDALGGPQVMKISLNEVGLGYCVVNKNIVKGMNSLTGVQTILMSEDNNDKALNSFLKTLAAGTDQEVTLTGLINPKSPLLTGMLSQTLTIKGARMLMEVEALTNSPVSGTNTTLTNVGITQFVTETSLAQNALGGPLTLQLLSEKGTFLANVVVDESISAGYNRLTTKCVVEKKGDNQDEIEEFLGNFLSGFDQKAVLKGPVGATAAFANNIVQAEAIIKGNNVPMIDLSMVDENTMAGRSVTVDGKTDSLRGPIITAHNPYNVSIIQKNMAVNVSLISPTEYRFESTAFGNHDCPLTYNITQQTTRKGMYANDINKDYVELKPNDRTSFFSPAVPLDAQAKQTMCKAIGLVSILPCCFMTVIPATACRARRDFGEDYIRLKVDGYFTLVIAGFEAHVHYRQKFVPLAFSPSIADGFLKDLEISCSNFHNLK